MKKAFCILFSLITCWQFTNAQVLVRCPGNVFSRCVPQEESALDTWTITPCDCNDPQNIYADHNYCRRTITLCSNNPQKPSIITAFDFPYYGLDPLSMLKLKGPNLQPLVSYMEPTGELDPNLSADDQLLALLLEIDTISKCVSFDAWVPMGEEHTIKVFTQSNETGNGWRYLPIPADDCSKVRTECHTFPSNFSVNGIAKEPQSSFITIFNPMENAIDINIKNLNITHPDIELLKMVLVSPQGTERILNTRFLESTLSTINVGFDDLGATLPATTTANSDVYQAEESFEGFRRESSFYGFWLLKVSTSGTAGLGSFNGWEAEFCIADDLCGPHIISPDRPQPIGDPFTTTNSIITIPEAGKISSLKITNLNIAHSNSGDLKATLMSPQGKKVVLFDQQCEGNGGYNLEFKDDAISGLDCNIVFKSSARPQGNFSDFIGEEAQGIWTLIVEDKRANNSGTLESWALSICTDCISNYNAISSNSLKGSLPIDYSYTARQNIESNQRINGQNTSPNTNVNYTAGSGIQLSEDFEVHKGVNFQAIIDNCN